MDIILTGIARSGTTLTCALLNKLPQAVALAEPMNPAELAALAYPDAYLARVEDFFTAQRTSLMVRGAAISKARDGQVPQNSFPEQGDPASLRRSSVSSQNVQFGKDLREGFRLVVKHPNFFTATLEALLRRYPCFAVVRNPLAVLLSWQTIQAPVNQGRLPAAEAFDPALARALQNEPDRVSRQLAILRWYFGRYRALLPREHVIRYEELVASGGRALSVIDPEAAQLDEALESRNTSTLYDPTQVVELADRLRADCAIYEGFYTPAEITDLRDLWISTS